MRTFTFDALIQKHPGLNAAFVEFPYNVKEEFSKEGRIKVLATFNEIEYRGLLVKMGADCHWIGITQEIRNKLGKGPGDIIKVTIREDLEPREVEMPQDFEEQLDKHTGLKAYFEKLSYTHKKEYVRWITDAKKSETREKRLIKTIELLEKGIKTPDKQKNEKTD